MELFKNVNCNQFFADARKLHDSLEDDKSKEIFLQRINWSTTGILKSYPTAEIKELIRVQNPTFDTICKHFENLDPAETIIFYGSGVFGRVILECFQFTIETHPNIIFCDRRAEDIKKFYNFPVITPKKLIQEYTTNKIYITTHLYRQAITDFLLESNIQKEAIDNHFTLDMIFLYESILAYNCFPYADSMKNQYFDDVVQFGIDEVFVDAGACDGFTSFQFAKCCPDYKKIYMLEPSPKSYQFTLENMTEKKLARAELIQIGLFSEKTTLHFKYSAESPGASRILETGDISIDVDTLDHFFIDNALENTTPPYFY